MNDNEMIDKIKEYISALFSSDSSGHDYWHTMRVYNIAMQIAEKEGGDSKLISVSALLHDVDDLKIFDTESYTNAKRIMNECELDDEFQRCVIEIIDGVSFSKNENKHPATLEGQIVQDADRLDALGAIGIARTFAYGGYKGNFIFEPQEPEDNQIEGTSLKKHSKTSIDHFYQKLFVLKDMMNTETARAMAAERDSFMRQFMDEFNKEWEASMEVKKKKKIRLYRRDGETIWYSHRWFRELLRIAANTVLVEMTDEEIKTIELEFHRMLKECNQFDIPHEDWRNLLRIAMKDYPEVLNAFLSAHKEENAGFFNEILMEMNKIVKSGDQSNGSVDSSLCSSKRALIVDALEKITYRNFHMTNQQKDAYNDGYIYVHDMGHRRDSINCCLFDMEKVLSGGFEMGEMWYEEPASLREAFDVIGSVSLNAAAQIYGGFTIPQIDELLVKYAQKSYDLYYGKFRAKGMEHALADALADELISEDFEKGFYSLEEKFNSIISPRGDYPFITISFGIGRDRYAQMATLAALKVRKNGHGTVDHKRPVLFPKLVFLFDKNLHENGKELYSLFQAAIDCSSHVMYPEYLSLTGNSGIVSDVYKKYGKVISPMCCRAFLNEWFERGGETPADDKDDPVFIGRFNIGVVSLNLPMILAKSRRDQTDFYYELDYYLELARQIHVYTYKYLSKLKAHTNPLAFMEGGLYGGTLQRDDTIEPLLKSSTASFGFTALNELQRLYNNKSLVEDGVFALEVIKYMNDKINEFKKQDGIQYSVYGTPAESLCGRQAQKFREHFGIIENVSDRAYFSNSFHCHVSEDITPIQKQNYEARFWDYANGGKIQYIRFTAPHNKKALEDIVLHAMELGLYEGINMSLVYCNSCGFEWKNERGNTHESCPKCGGSEFTMIERMCGYIAYTRLHGNSRLNEAKMAEIEDRVCM